MVAVTMPCNMGHGFNRAKHSMGGSGTLGGGSGTLGGGSGTLWGAAAV